MDEQIVHKMVHNLEAITTALHVLVWVLGIALLPLLGWGVTMTWTVMQTRADTKLLVTMHRSPEKYGFGTESGHQETQGTMKEMTRAVKSLTHYICWLSEQTTGKKPPPEVPGDS